jgi:DnaJ family protein A protein 5
MFSGTAEYPSFGNSTWQWNSPTEDGRTVKQFYTVWLTFSTEKDFVWSEKWDLSEAPDRRVRR